jgi:death on curing protein
MMHDIIFLELDEVVEIHRDQIQRYGGLHGVRDTGLLESAITMPSAMFAGEYLHRNLFEMAAAYLFHIVKDHPFHDGNKRTGAVAAIVFLKLNGIEPMAAEHGFEDLIRQVADGMADKAAVAAFLNAGSA